MWIFRAGTVSTELLLLFHFQHLQSFHHGKVSSKLSKEVARLQNVIFPLNRNLGKVPCCSAKPEEITSNPSGCQGSSSSKDND